MWGAGGAMVFGIRALQRSITMPIAAALTLEDGAAVATQLMERDAHGKGVVTL